MRKLKGIVVHHSDTKTGNVSSFKRYHVDVLGWRTIGYHYVILTDGTIEVGRPLNMRGAHTRGNNDTIGICVVGKLENQPPAPEQYISLIRLISSLCFVFNFNPEGSYKHKGKIDYIISGHRDFCSTGCPGAVFYKMLPQIRIDTEKKLEEHLNSLKVK